MGAEYSRLLAYIQEAIRNLDHESLSKVSRLTHSNIIFADHNQLINDLSRTLPADVWEQIEILVIGLKGARKSHLSRRITAPISTEHTPISTEHTPISAEQTLTSTEPTTPIEQTSISAEHTPTTTEPTTSIEHTSISTKQTPTSTEQVSASEEQPIATPDKKLLASWEADPEAFLSINIEFTRLCEYINAVTENQKLNSIRLRSVVMSLLLHWLHGDVKQPILEQYLRRRGTSFRWQVHGQNGKRRV
jgi:hypothetical protein